MCEPGKMGDFSVVPKAHLQKGLGHSSPPSPVAAICSVPPVNLPGEPGSMPGEKRLCRVKLAQLVFLLREVLLNFFGKGTWPACPQVAICHFIGMYCKMSPDPHVPAGC